ncbi:hypothetical protein Pint_15756 [Pistacia integerrima]|uniref:Uncharacterized protein n=1 Tax=Pistacia integerrima TaxID=434235 RepID=A0ACC0Z923_9ROSI|nr:hypothetical protein Pint_15756 [Pistacia integerrima]
MAYLVPSLSSSFQQVPPVAIPPMLDCLLASTGLSAATIFDSLLDAFPDLTKDAMKEGELLNSEQCNNIASIMVALCHLLKKLGKLGIVLYLLSLEEGKWQKDKAKVAPGGKYSTTSIQQPSNLSSTPAAQRSATPTQSSLPELSIGSAAPPLKAEDASLELSPRFPYFSGKGWNCPSNGHFCGAHHEAFQSFMWKSFIPLMKMIPAFDHEMLNQIEESFFNVVTKTNSWEVLEKTLVPCIVSSVGLSLGMLKHEGSEVIEQGSCSLSLGLKDQIKASDTDKECMPSLCRSFSLSTACHILTLMLDAALKSLQAARNTNSMLENGCCYAEKFAANMLWNLCNMTEQLLLQSLEHRSCAISFFLPIILKAFVSQHSFEITVHGHTHVLSRNSFLKKIWNCCRTLFTLGPLERRDAYSVLSLYLSFFSCTEGPENPDVSVRVEEFDITAERELWDEIKRGLVDEEGLVRKQSLHILKTVLQISGESQAYSSVSERNSQEKHSTPRGMTKRELWAATEAKSLGVGKLGNSIDSGLKGRQQWEAFILLYEMLAEYGTHLVEAAWNHQVTLLLQYSVPRDNCPSSVIEAQPCQMETSAETFIWLSILWERGFHHGNPQVRCLIMQSFLGIEWKNYENCANLVPESFVLGPFMEGLNDPVHHKDFGVKGVYSSRTIEGAARFLHQYTSFLITRTLHHTMKDIENEFSLKHSVGAMLGWKRIAFLSKLASISKQQSFGRVGMMTLAECIASAACVDGTHDSRSEWCADAFPEKAELKSSQDSSSYNDKSDLLDVLRFIIESSKQHFNPNYRLRVCEKVLEAATSLVCSFDVPLDILLHFISALPREFTDYGDLSLSLLGSLRARVQEWLSGCGGQHSANCCKTHMLLLRSLHDFPETFSGHPNLDDSFVTYDDEEMDSWEFQAKRWARVLFLVVKEENHLTPILKFIQDIGINICKQNNCTEWKPVKFLILTLSLVLEFQIMQERSDECGIRFRTKSEVGSLKTVDQYTYAEAAVIYEKLANLFPHVLEELVSFANLSCSIFWSSVMIDDTSLPRSVRGKLGGPSQRRLSSSTTTAVLQAVGLLLLLSHLKLSTFTLYFYLEIMSVKAVASILSWCARAKTDASLKFAYAFFWNFFRKTITTSTHDSESGAEICLAAYEALASVLQAVVSPQALCFVRENDKSMLLAVEGQPWMDSWVLSFLQNVNSLLEVGVLARTRRAILLNWKWLCIESLLSIPHCARENGEISSSFFSDAAVKCIFKDLVDSLENAGEGSMLPMLRSIRLTMDLFASGIFGSVVSLCSGVDSQMMWRLVRSSWILHVNCKKRRVAPIAALLSSVLHSSVFCDEGMHVKENSPGPLKWFVEKILEEGSKSPRTIRLAALHLTGLWLSNPRIIKYYIKELKLLTLYGSVAFDEDFEAELGDNYDAKTEVSLLAKSPDPELTETFINTELYARVSVAVLFYKLANLADVVGLANENKDWQAALDSGKMFLLELLDLVANDKDLAKELYKKYSAIHRRKVRAWQMICVLSSFVDHDIVGEVTRFLRISLYVGEQLVPILRDYDMKPQALSSYVFIAANIILNASKAVQTMHLDELLPPIVPLLTSHHHSLRGFTQLLVYHVLCKLFPPESETSQVMPLEKRCFEDLKSYLAKNSDCMRLRASMEGYLDAYNPNLSITPAGIFVNRVEELEFECVPRSLMEQVLNFLNDVREDLRCSMAKDIVTIKNESLKISEDPDCTEILHNPGKEELLPQLHKDSSLDFQKKITLSKHEKQDANSSSLSRNRETYKQLSEMEKEDELFDQALQSRSVTMEKIRASRQHFVLVASLIDRVPNLAGLARTCEVYCSLMVLIILLLIYHKGWCFTWRINFLCQCCSSQVFKASGLAIADANILRDKQFQLISVTAEKWVPIIEVPVNSVKLFLERKKREGFSILGLEQTANSIPLDHYNFPKMTVLVLGREKEGIPVDIIHMLDACIEIPQLGVVRSLNVHVSGAIALWEYTRQHRVQ